MCTSICFIFDILNPIQKVFMKAKKLLYILSILFFIFSIKNQTVFAQGIYQKNLENKGYYENIPLPEKMRSEFLFFSISNYFEPKNYSLKRFNSTFFRTVKRISDTSKIKILPVYGYFMDSYGIKSVSAGQYKNR